MGAPGPARRAGGSATGETLSPAQQVTPGSSGATAGVLGGSKPASGEEASVTIEAARPQEQPGQAAAEPARVARRVDRSGWSSATTGPRTAARAALSRRARSSSSRVPARAGAVPVRRRGAGHGRRREDPRGHPPADVELLGAGHRERDDRRVRPQRDHRPADPERPDPAGRPADRPLRHLGEDAAVGDDRPRRRDVLVDADAAAPDRQEPAEPVDQRPPASGVVNVDGALPRNQTRGSTGRAWTTRNGSIQPRWAAPTRR